jgi:hypothetical protein
MTTREQHEQQASENFALHELLLRQERHLDWAATALAYSALHYIDACLLPRDPRDHAARNSLIRQTPALRPVWANYRFLLEKSRDARYECYDPTPGEVQRFRRQHYDPIVTLVLQLLRART